MKRLKRKEYLVRNEKVIDFMIGFFGWYILNGVLSVLLFLPSGLLQNLAFTQDFALSPDMFQTLNGILGIVLLCLPLLINVGLLVYFAFTRYWISIGGLSAFAASLAATICLGIFFTAACFAILASYNTQMP